MVCKEYIDFSLRLLLSHCIGFPLALVLREMAKKLFLVHPLHVSNDFVVACNMPFFCLISSIKIPYLLIFPHLKSAPYFLLASCNCSKAL